MPKIHASQVVWTHHVQQRLRERGLSQSRVLEALTSPTTVHPGKRLGTYEFAKRAGRQTVTAIVQEDDRGKWVVISAWMDPPRSGTKDERQQSYYQRYRRAGFLGKFWYLFLRQLGWW